METKKDESEKWPIYFTKHAIEGGILVTASDGSLLIFDKEGQCWLEVINESGWEIRAILRNASDSVDNNNGIASYLFLDTKRTLYYDEKGQSLFSESRITKYGRILRVFKDGLPHCDIAIEEEDSYSVDGVRFFESAGNSDVSTKEAEGDQAVKVPPDKGYIIHSDASDIFHLMAIDKKIIHRFLFNGEITLDISFTNDGLPFISSYIGFNDYKVSRSSIEKFYSMRKGCGIISLPHQEEQDIEPFVNQKFQDEYRCHWKNNPESNS